MKRLHQQKKKKLMKRTGFSSNKYDNNIDLCLNQAKPILA